MYFIIGDVDSLPKGTMNKKASPRPSQIFIDQQLWICISGFSSRVRINSEHLVQVVARWPCHAIDAVELLQSLGNT